MSQTKHRSVKIDNKNSNQDEIEQSMHIKDHRAKKKSINKTCNDLDGLDDDLQAEVEYLLSKNR